MTINFTANLIRQTNIPKLNEEGKYRPAKVSVVELDKNDNNDINALYQTYTDWKWQGAKYSKEIYEEAVKGYEYDQVLKEHYFAVTEQKDDFEKLDSSKILGLMMYSETFEDADEIDWLQVRPNTNSIDSWNREYKKVGKTLIDTIKNSIKDRTVHVTSARNAIGFYKEQGFANRKEDKVAVSLYLEV